MSDVHGATCMRENNFLSICNVTYKETVIWSTCWSSA